MQKFLRQYWYVLCILPYLGFWTYGLTDLDEGFYGAVTMDMLRRGDWLTPTLNGIPWFEKPILSFWLAMPSVALMPNEFGARLPSFLCTMATVWLIYRFAKRHFCESTAIVSCLVYSSSLLVVAIGRMMMTDAALNLCLVIAFTTFYESLQGNQKLRLITATALGFAVLAKGPVALVLFGLIGIFTFARLPQFRPEFKKYWIIGSVLLITVVSTWYVPAYLVNGQFFIDKFLIEQNIGRFAGGDKAHTVPAWAHPIYFPAVLILATLPWIGGASRAKFWQTKIHEQSPYPASTFILIWFLVPLCFFTISGTKLVHYILPSLPPLAILIAHALLTRHPKFSFGKEFPLSVSMERGPWGEVTLPTESANVGGNGSEDQNQQSPSQNVVPPAPQGEDLGGGRFSSIGNEPGFDRALKIAAITSITTLALAQFAFSKYWNDRFRDVQSLAIMAREKNLQLYEANLGRPAGSDPEIKFQLDDSGHPSLGFYYQKPILPYENELPSNALIIGRDHTFDQYKSNPQVELILKGRYSGLITGEN